MPDSERLNLSAAKTGEAVRAQALGLERHSRLLAEAEG
jgi:hypothetical protein